MELFYFQKSPFRSEFPFRVSPVGRQGVSPTRASLLVAVMGASNTAGRLAVGLLSGLQNMDVLLLNNVSMLGSGLVALLIPLCETYSAYAVVTAVFGLLSGELAV